MGIFCNSSDFSLYISWHMKFPISFRLFSQYWPSVALDGPHKSELELKIMMLSRRKHHCFHIIFRSATLLPWLQATNQVKLLFSSRGWSLWYTLWQTRSFTEKWVHGTDGLIGECLHLFFFVRLAGRDQDPGAYHAQGKVSKFAGFI